MREIVCLWFVTKHFNQIQSLQWFCITMDQFEQPRNYKFLDIYFSDIFGRTCQLYSATFNRTFYGTFLSGVIVVKSSCQLLSFSREKTALGSFYSFINACSPLIFCGIWFIFCFSYICIFTCQLQYFFAQTKLSKQ